MGAADRARSALVDGLRAARRVPSPAVEDAFRAVPRHVFLPDLPLAEAYADEAVAVQHVDGIATSSASQPSMMAIMLEQLGLRRGHRVLEIGAGTGYNAALMARIVGPHGAVFSVDIDPDLVDGAAAHLAAAGVSGVHLLCADGALGHPPGAPYDRIVLTVGSADVRPEWVEQLAPNGRLLLPLAVRGSQLSVALDLGADGVLRSDSVRSCSFIRLRGIGAGAQATVPLATAGLAVQIPEDAAEPVDLAGIDAALAAPGPFRPVGQRLGPADVWDGFGLWLAVTEPGVCRVVAIDSDDERAIELIPLGAELAAVAVADAAGAPGLAAVVTGHPGGRADRERRAGVRPFGAAGPAVADRMFAALDRWIAAGRPGAAQLRLEVVPGSVPLSPVRPGATVVEKQHCVLVVGWPSDPARASAPLRAWRPDRADP